MRPLWWLWQLPAEYRLILAAAAIALVVLVDALITLSPS